jgi:hypothetical protein
MIKYTKVNGGRNIEKFYNKVEGNLYYRHRGTKEPFKIVDGFDVNDIKIKWAYDGWELIYVEGHAANEVVVA